MKKLLFIFLLIPSIAGAASDCTGTLVLSAGVVVSKDIVCGNTSGISSEQASRKAKDASLSFINFALPDAAFEATPVPLAGKALTLSNNLTVLDNAGATDNQKLTALISYLKNAGILK